jgi:hypothetical protein
MTVYRFVFFLYFADFSAVGTDEDLCFKSFLDGIQIRYVRSCIYKRSGHADFVDLSAAEKPVFF